MSKLDLATRPTPTERRSEQVQWLNLQLAIAARRANVCQRLPQQPRVNVDSKLAALAQELAKQVAAEFPAQKLHLPEVFEAPHQPGAAPQPKAAAAKPRPSISIAPVAALPEPAPPEEYAFAGESDWFEVQGAADEEDMEEDGTEFVF